ncbi:MAG: IS110 family RNA-guided transposase, partial [Vulcanimicrobiaceae bacterium]
MEAVLGIDISKATFCACAPIGERSNVREFPNNRTGFRKLAMWLKGMKIGSLHACMESTNRYWEALAGFLHEQGHQVSVVNPYRTAAYWKSEHLRAKTDRIDAAMIARFCRSQNPQSWEPPSPQQHELRALVREAECLKAERRRFKTRLEHGGYSFKRIIGVLSKEIGALEARIIKLIRSDSTLWRHYRNLRTAPGIGKVTAYIMLAEIGPKVHHLDRDELVSYAGLAPRIFESGTSIRRSKGTNNAGNHRVKRALFMPALAAARSSPHWKTLKQQMVKRGKPPKVAIGAIMRKLFVLACGILKSGQPYNA